MHADRDAIDISSKLHIPIHQPLQYYQKERVEADRMKGHRILE
jgi:hypothetical protein